VRLPPGAARARQERPIRASAAGAEGASVPAIPYPTRHDKSLYRDRREVAGRPHCAASVAGGPLPTATAARRPPTGGRRGPFGVERHASVRRCRRPQPSPLAQVGPATQKTDRRSAFVGRLDRGAGAVSPRSTSYVGTPHQEGAGALRLRVEQTSCGWCWRLGVSGDVALVHGVPAVVGESGVRTNNESRILDPRARRETARVILRDRRTRHRSIERQRASGEGAGLIPTTRGTLYAVRRRLTAACAQERQEILDVCRRTTGSTFQGTPSEAFRS
jgi:hypothetical protein